MPEPTTSPTATRSRPTDPRLTAEIRGSALLLSLLVAITAGVAAGVPALLELLG